MHKYSILLALVLRSSTFKQYSYTSLHNILIGSKLIKKMKVYYVNSIGCKYYCIDEAMMIVSQGVLNKRPRKLVLNPLLM